MVLLRRTSVKDYSKVHIDENVFLLSIDSVIQYQFQIALSQRWNRVTIHSNTVSRTTKSKFLPVAIAKAFLPS